MGRCRTAPENGKRKTERPCGATDRVTQQEMQEIQEVQERPAAMGKGKEKRPSL